MFRAGQVATSLAGATKVRCGESPREAYALLTSRNFDQAPVFQGAKKCVGLVRTTSLATAPSVEEVTVWLKDCTIVGVDAPLRDVLRPLCHDRMIFLAGNRGLESFVTISDLNRHAVRGHFYLLLSQIEMLLSDIVDASVDNALIEEAITGSAAGRWRVAKAKGFDPRPVEFLDLEQLANLFESTVDDSPGWNKQLHDQLVALSQFRPAVMHATRPLLGRRPPSTLAKLAEDAAAVSEQIRQFLPVSTACEY